MNSSGAISHQTIVASDNCNPVDILAKETALAKQQIKLAMKQGAVWLARAGKPRRIRRAKSTLLPGDQLFLYYDNRILSLVPPSPKLIADERQYSVWYKPRGLLSQGSRWGDHCSIARWVEQNHQPQRNAFLIHRLDKAASGLMVIGHHKKATTLLAESFAKRQVDKRYRAIVAGIYDPNSMPATIRKTIDDRSATTHVTLLGQDLVRQRSLLEVRIETGRKHQIRCHLHAIGLPIVGDRLYADANQQDDLQLTACHLAFGCPISGEQKTYILNADLMPSLES